MHGLPTIHRLNAVKQWRKEPPPEPGVYLWRRSWQWEPIDRALPPSRRVFSHRYEKEVPVEQIGGEWFY